MSGRIKAMMLLGSLVISAAVGGALVPRQTGAQFLSPGKLSSAHAELEGDANCSECHSTGQRLDTNACLSCHDDLRVRIRQQAGLHGREYRGQECGGCHVEHLGRSAQLVRWPGGVQARFDHRQSGWTLKGAHASVRCEDCHDSRNRRGAASFLGLKTECVSCHEDPHEARFAGAECVSCHNETDWIEVTNVKKNHPVLSLAGGHAKTKCEACHDKGNVEPPSAGSDCVACHAQVHEAKFGDRCENCHASIRWTGLPKKIGLRAHPRTAFPLEGMHRDVACKGCHSPKLPLSQRYRRLQFDQCADCHETCTAGASEAPTVSLATTSRGSGRPCSPSSSTAAPSSLSMARHQSVPCTGCHQGKRPHYKLELKAQALRRLPREPTRRAVRHGDESRRLRPLSFFARMGLAEHRSQHMAADRRARRSCL